MSGTGSFRERRGRRGGLHSLFASLLLASLVTAALPTDVGAQWRPVSEDALEPATSGGLPRLIRLLERIGNHRRVLVIGAHPDDEDTSLLAHIALGDGGEAAYLSLSRGDGGQNVIGPELGVGLGLLRSQELVSARRIDGARQFFTRAYDFGYSRSLEETLSLWPGDELLEDAVRVVRRFRPHLIVSVFPPDERAGHGQHQAAGVIAEQVFTAAGDPARFADQLEEGLEPWQAQRFFRSAWFDRSSAALDIPLGELDPVTGKSYLQLAMASRSEHRSQDMGMEQRLGPRSTALLWVAGGEAAPPEPFAGIDTTLGAIAALEDDVEARRTVEAELARAEAALGRARAELRADDPSSAAPGLRDALAGLRAARSAAVAAASRELLDEKIALASEALLVAENVVLDVVADREQVAQGSAAEIVAQLYNQGSAGLGAEVTLIGEPGWQLPPAARVEVAAGQLGELAVAASVDAAAPASRPYFLDDGSAPEVPALYRWPIERREIWGAPFEPPALRARFAVDLPGVETPVIVEREVVHRYRDQVLGEVRRPVRVVPRVEVGVEPGLLLWPLADGRPRTIDVSLRSWAEEALGGRIEVTVPPGWSELPPTPFELGPGDQRVVAVGVPRPDEMSPGRHPFAVTAVVTTAGGVERRYDLALDVVDYPHVRPTVWPRRARFEVSAGELRLPAVDAVGYFRGASDEVPEVLASIGVPIELLDAGALAEAPDTVLDRFSVIVIGSRAYEVDPALAELHPKLMRWVERGGTLVVQYHKYPLVSGGFFPYPLSIARPHGRVADETAPVTVLDRDHPVFRHPNPIGDEDWQGWVQERGLYFPDSWDDRYTPLLELADPGRPPERGALLVAPVGEGTWVYSGLAFFRQLPEGVVGATRLFLNLLSLGE